MNFDEVISSYMPETKEVSLGKFEDGNLVEEHIKVVFVASNVQVSRSKALELLDLLDGSIKAKAVDTDELDEKGKPKKTIDFDFDFTKIIKNMSSASMKGIEDFIQKNCKVSVLFNGEMITADMRNKLHADHVFTLYPEQYINFLTEGVKFHFAKHLPSGNGLLTNLANKAVNKMQLANLAANSK